ncbi:MAG: FAD-dependent oxidoreductase [Microbacteriaceae bacterium]|jgi:NADPH-dependent 2,4-dienoyl-CoA reductase/sulfur reductase-like enzyme/rhodanese-related sulfurtransferase|nr:FAD-dependent oxidoreductase [Microbacteriaceae bacterium]MCI1207240.1 FAD-dependent oxidoreductase [Microbacteriaceae bacterium]
MKLLVIGGNAAGMSCAARARRNDEHAEITVLERGTDVSYASCGLPYFIGGEIATEEPLRVQTPDSLSRILNITVRTGTEAIAIDPHTRHVTARTAEGLQELSYDALMLAPGASPVLPPIPGLDTERTTVLRTIDDATRIRAHAPAGSTAVVIGGGFIGIEAAEALAANGLDVHIVDMAPHILPPLEPEIAAIAEHELRDRGVTLHTRTTAERLESTPTHAAVHLATGETLSANIVLVAVGVRPDTEFVSAAGIQCERGAIVVDAHGRTSQPGIWAAGDAVQSTDMVTGASHPVALAGPANRAGRLIADDICGLPHPRCIPATLGTAIIRVGAQTLARTGAGRTDLAHAGIPFQAIHIEAANHAGYFPGAKTLRILALMGEDGRLLGAQVAGQAGADTRIDVLAAAIRRGAHLDDLIDDDLAYSPPYGQAKDPINLLGMVGENVRTGQLRLWYAEQLDDMAATHLILDVRSRAEYAQIHLQGSLNIPHTEIRTHLNEIRNAAAGRPIAVTCASGKRSYLAHRILVQNGFDSRSLSGGMNLLQDTLPTHPLLIRPQDRS